MTTVAPERAEPGGYRAVVQEGRLATLSHGLFPEENRILFGVQTAVSGFVRALFRHSRLMACDVFAPPTTIEAARRQVARLGAGGARPAGHVWPSERLPSYVTASPPLAMHDPTGDLFRLHYLRSHVAPGQYPITAVHHTVSYLRWRHETILPLVMAGYRPCDALICGGAAARKAVAALIGQVQETLREEYGLDLPFRGRLEVIPLGVDTAALKPRDKMEARAQLGLPAHKFVLLSLGRFSVIDKMDLAPVLQVFRELQRASRHELLLVLAGSDPHDYAATVRTLAQELGIQADVMILRDVSPLAPPLLYAAADLFISLSDNMQEMFGLTPLEAMASGLPVVVSDWDGYRETVAHGETGFRVPTLWSQCDRDLCSLALFMPPLHDHALLAQSVAVDCGKLFEYLMLLIEDDPLRKKMGEAARRRVVTEYEWEAVVRRYEALWEELANEARGLPPDAKRHLGFMRPDYTAAFAHFATRLLTPDMRLRLTERGERTVKGKEPLRLNSMVAPSLNKEALHQALALLRGASRLRRALAANTVLILLRERGSLSEPAAQRHLLWLMKHGLVEVDGR